MKERQTDGCDKMSRVYEDMFNILQEVMQNEEKLKELSPLDYSALGMYIGKFVEQEINSSVVQIMRAFCGIDMPEYYCKRYPSYDIDADIVTPNRKIRLNEQKEYNDTHSLKSIPLGDAYYALQQLKEEDDEGYFNKYPWLNDRIFLEAWRNLFVFRNKMAHIGEIIDADTLKKNYDYFLRFLRYMPDMLKAKKDLAPDDYIDNLPSIEKEKEKEKKPYYDLSDRFDKPYAPKEVAKRYCELLETNNKDENWEKEINGIIEKYNLDAMLFEGENGKIGMMDCLGNILVPANYDGFGFIPKPLDDEWTSVIAVRNGKYVVVALDGSGFELTKEPYDEIKIIVTPVGSPYMFRKNGSLSWGLMKGTGEEICDCIIDSYGLLTTGIWFTSGNLQGLWEFGIVFLPPIYDNIEVAEDFEDPLLFTLNGVLGHVKFDGSFISLSELAKLDENEQDDILSDCVCDYYDPF